MLGLVFILLIFLFPETKWHRLHPNEITKETVAISSRENITTIDSDNDQHKGVMSNAQDVMFDEDSEARVAAKDPSLGKGKPSKQQFKLWQPNAAPFKTLALDFWTPWRLFAFPIVEFAAFVVSWSASSFLTINLTQAQNFAAPPYNFSAQAVGFTNFALLIGTILGLLTNGPLSDWIAARATKKNRGIREPEMRLPTLIPYVCIMLLGNFVVAFGYQHKWNWKVSLT